jgi:hypothetical protein
MKVKIITTTDYSEKELEEQVNYWFDFKWRDTWELVDIKYTYQYICNTAIEMSASSVMIVYKDDSDF